MSIPELKKALCVIPHSTDPLGKINFRINDNTGKVFAYADTTNGQVKIKVQQALDPALPVRFLYEPDKFDEGCITNVKESKPDLFSL
jgi:hypothetical protein